MIKGAKIGERVRVLERARGERTVWRQGAIVARWPQGCTRGVITASYMLVTRRYIEVAPDHPKGIGSITFRPGELERELVPIGKA